LGIQSSGLLLAGWRRVVVGCKEKAGKGADKNNTTGKKGGQKENRHHQSSPSFWPSSLSCFVVFTIAKNFVA
jgi:hypothetical protein